MNMSRYHQSGNVIFIILIAVALFGALSFAVSQGFSGANTSRITKQQAKAAAAAIIKYATDVEQAISRMQLVNDCADNQVSFERAPFDGSDTDYVNPNAPGDFSCHVFHPNGGAMPYQPPVADYLDGVNTSSNGYGEYVFINACVNGIGTSYDAGPACNSSGNDVPYVELVLIMPYVNLEICEALNSQLGFDSTPEQDGGTMWSDAFKFSGSFSATAPFLGAVGSSGDFSRCLEGDVDPSSGTYHYYHVLVPR